VSTLLLMSPGGSSLNQALRTEHRAYAYFRRKRSCEWTYVPRPVNESDHS
jgi:hypothetical protein